MAEAGDPSGVADVTLALVAHTNVGKTTLARTLLRRDVGEVLDQAHVTLVSEAHEVLRTPRARLLLEDTPGFGDSPRLLRRLRAQGNPVGWFLHQVWDRLKDRPLFCAQEAVRTVRDRADVVLYLVNATERPQDAGYVDPEMAILAFTQKPVLVLLNQTGPTPAPEVPAAWAAWAGGVPHVRGVLSLDAFTRCWVEERTLLDAAARLLPVAKQPAMAGLVEAWSAREVAALGRCSEAVAAFLIGTASDRALLPERAGRGEKAKAMEALAERVTTATRALLADLLAAHALEGVAAATVEERLGDFTAMGLKAPDGKRSATLGAVLTGAASGLAADLAVGGLSFGGGAVIGAILGFFGGAALPKVYAWVAPGGPPLVAWSDDGLARLARGAVTRYVAVAHFGRGRGAWRDLPLPAALEAAVLATEARRGAALRAALKPFRASGASPTPAPGDARPADARPGVASAVRAWLVDLLTTLYPSSSSWLR